MELTGCEKEETVKCEHCEKETPAGDFARCPDCGMNWLCTKCRKWNRVERRPDCEHSALNVGLCVALREAANCALWLLSQPELKSLIDGEWGDPIAIKEMLEKAGCVPSCEKANT